ncbi:hypothetical protein [Beggiatoa leptomitoformis]|uniref:Nudix hydrolase domain-containing protein n=1 Tax=Beggiatoa leptomitoformis TaxID=288004 RepID=A0A2N9YCV8_9GAMM|nr:hypothetical protein [Beggiatoa leptomitoformis]ALG69245.1 hypothetical protein AL038_18100 [Beggiatoa leptomitoformis]AUI68318.1 hypothetical protein BLE401_06115 [Beggiatoa leptomitoformis]
MPNLFPLKTLLKHLPIHVKEGHHRSTVKRAVLIDCLMTESELSLAEAILLLDVIERILTSVAVLDKESLQAQAWCFVSFPAQSFATALLQILADEQQNVLDQYFWEVYSISHENIVSEQHQLLSWLEKQRLQHHQTHQAQPINYVANSAAFVKLDDQFLLHQREGNLVKDQNGEFVLIGGCTNFSDLDDLDLSFQEKLMLLKNPLDLPYSVVEKTLIREVKEETTLEYQQDYTVFFIDKLNPYRQLSGSGVNYAYTTYYFNLFYIQLTKNGFFRLLQAEQNKPQIFSRFSLDEFAESKTKDGKTAYIDVLHAHFGNDPLIFKQALNRIPSAFINSYRFAKETDSITLPLHQQRPLRIGTTGKERSIAIPLTTRQCQLLWLLGAHARHFRISSCAIVFQRLPYGWIQALHIDLINELQTLATLFREYQVDLLDFAEGHYFRLAIDPQFIFFDEANFQAFLSKVAQEPYQINLESRAVETPWAMVESISLVEKLTPSLGVSLHELILGKLSAHHEIDKEKIDKFIDLTRKKINCKTIGLRLLLRTEENKCRLACNLSAKINGKKFHIEVI